MKQNKIPMLFSILLFTLVIASCSNEDKEITIQKDNIQDDGIKTCTMNFIGNVPSYEVNAQSTRTSSQSSSSDWSDGTILYLRFTTASSIVNGTATYSSTKGWSISYSGVLPSNYSNKVAVYYIEEPVLTGATSISLDDKSILYIDTEGIYEYDSNSNTCTVSANLSPNVSRIRFKGTSGTSIKIDGISTYSSYNISTGEFSLSSKTIKLSVENSGYTPYVYGILTDSNSRALSVANGDYIYTMNCSADVLAVGETGYMDIPTEASHNGWEVKAALATSGAVDLGLSVKWAACNVGASSPEEYGNYYAWGETTTKTDYSANTYIYKKNSYTYTNIGENIAGTSYDVSYITLGSGWQMPSVEQAQELIDNCDCEKITYNNVSGCKFTGPNGNAIFIPYSGGYNGLENNEKNRYAYLWLANYYSDSDQYAYYLDVGYNISIENYLRCRGYTIRPIYTK